MARHTVANSTRPDASMSRPHSNCTPATRRHTALPLRIWCQSNSASSPNSSREAIFRRDGHHCVYCQRALTEDGDTFATVDHILPQCLFSTYAVANRDINRVACCLRCNRSKRDWCPTTLAHRAWFDRDYCLKFIAKIVLSRAEQRTSGLDRAGARRANACPI